MTGLRIFILSSIYFAFSTLLIFAFGPPGVPKVPAVSISGGCPLKLNFSEGVAKLLTCALTNFPVTGGEYLAECKPKVVWDNLDVPGCLITYFFGEMEKVLTCVPKNVSELITGVGGCVTAKIAKIASETNNIKVDNSTKTFDHVPECWDPIWRKLVFEQLPKCALVYFASLFKKPGSNAAIDAIGSSTTNNDTMSRDSKGTQTEPKEKEVCLDILTKEVEILEKFSRECSKFTKKIRRMITTYQRVRKEVQALRESCPAKKPRTHIELDYDDSLPFPSLLQHHLI